MKVNFFKETTASYIAVNSDGFELDGKQYGKLECSIKQITPVRKLFKGKKSNVILMMPSAAKMVSIAPFARNA